MLHWERRETALLVDPTSDDLFSGLHIATVVAHEISHQWWVVGTGGAGGGYGGGTGRAGGRTGIWAGLGGVVVTHEISHQLWVVGAGMAGGHMGV